MRLIGFFLIVLVVLRVAQHLPVVGALFQIPFLGFWFSAILVSVVGSKGAAALVDRRKQRALERQLGTVDTPHNLGKLGTLLLSQGRSSAALEYLERAVDGEPEVPEWRYRTGCAYLRLGQHAEAIAALGECLALKEGHAYGQVLLRLAESHQGQGHFESALEYLERFETNHGPTPESAYRRGIALKALGRKSTAKQAFDSVSELARQAPIYQRNAALPWRARSFLARF